VQVEVDTGMRRHGVAAADAPAFVRRLLALPALRLAGLYTHFAGLDRAALPWLQAQLRALLEVRQALAAALEQGPGAAPDPAPLLSACNTLAACLLPAGHLDAVRIGGGLYGLSSGTAGIELRPALTLKSRIAALRCAAAGDRVGYGGAHRCAGATRLALLPCGYADGLPRAHWDGAEVLLRGRRARIVGHVSMNQTVVDVGHVGDAAVGDEVVLLGEQQGEAVRAEQRTPPGGSVYEVTCLLPAGLPRVYRGAATGRAAAPAAARRAP
jgi:alanine racemase